MHLTWLGWAGVQLAHGDHTIVIDPLADARAVFAPMVAPEADLAVPAVAPARAGAAVAGLLTHLHRDHADAGALTHALAAGAPVYGPPAAGGAGLENLALAQAEHELAAAGLTVQPVEPWEQRNVGPFTLTALPASDGIGDPQVAWLVEAGGVRVLHLGDTMFHGAWWRMALRHGPFDAVLVPVNGAQLSFPYRAPASSLPGVLDPGQAAIAAEILGAGVAIPIHAEGYELDGTYVPVAGAADAFAAAAQARGVRVHLPELGEPLSLSPTPAGG